MESSGLRSRSRSKTPFLRSSCDRESCGGGDDHAQHKTGRKTPTKRRTPIKQLKATASTAATEPIVEVDEYESPPAHHTRQSTRMTERFVKTSDYSSEESLDRLRMQSHPTKEIVQNEINSGYERVLTSSSHQRYSTLADFPFSPIHTSNVCNVSHDRSSMGRSSRLGSPAGHSSCSTDSSFAEQALADVSLLLERDPARDHLPYRLYKMAGEYWNKYPKTDYTYSPLSKDRVELAPGQVAMPNMSRRSLACFRTHGPNNPLSGGVRATRAAAIESSDDESYYRPNGGLSRHAATDQRWLITRILISIVTAITSVVSSTYNAVAGPSHRYPYTERKARTAGAASAAASAAALAASPLVWIYSFFKKVVTTTVTTVTETITGADERAGAVAVHSRRRRWPWLLLLLPLLGYGCYHYADEILDKQPLIESYKPPMANDQDFPKRVAAVEAWAATAATTLNQINQRLANLDNLEAKLQKNIINHLHNNFINIVNSNDNSEGLALRLKEYFDGRYMSKEESERLVEDVRERLVARKPDLDEEQVRRLIQEYLAGYERKHAETQATVDTLRTRIEEVSNLPTPACGECPDPGCKCDPTAVRQIVASMLDVYDADKTGLVDYALESAGGQVISTRCTELYQIKTKQYSILGLPIWWVYTSPRHALTPGAAPADCWAFQGFPGYLVIRLYAVIEVTGFSLEHLSRLLAADGRIESAPNRFSVYGLHDETDPEPHLFGDYFYDANGTAIQYFPVKYPKTTDINGVKYPVAYDIVELRIESNHGNPTYTCVYRFRVHGNPLSDIREATEDSIKDSEAM